MVTKLKASDAQRSIKHKDISSKVVMYQSSMNHLSQQVQYLIDENAHLKRKIVFCLNSTPYGRGRSKLVG